MLRFSGIVKIQWKNERVTEKIISYRTEMSKSINDTETKYASVEDPLSMHRIVSNETTLFSELPNIINE